MKLNLTIRPTADRRGFALVTTLLVLTLAAVLTVGALTGSLSSVRMAGSDYQDARVFYAAEAGAEASLVQLERGLHDGHLSDEDLLDIHPPTLDGINYEGFRVDKSGSPYVETITDGPYVGLYALTQDIEIESWAKNEAADRAAIILSAKAQAIPIFQFGVFFEEDLEATNGPPFEFMGRVHSNGNIYLSSNNAWYRDMVTTPNKVVHNRKDFNLIYNGVFINDASGREMPLDFDSRSVPDPEAFKGRSCAAFDCRLQTDAFGVDSLRLPLPEGVPASELVRPRESSDTDAEREAKFAWNADLYVTVDLVNLRTRGEVCGAGGGGDPTPWPLITAERPAGRPLPVNPDLCNIFQWAWSDFYDGREKALKDVLNFHVAQLSDWAAGDSIRSSEIVYVEFLVPSNIAGYTSQQRDLLIDGELDPAVRLVNASTLPNRMSVATEWPLYVKGDYNRVSKKPAALVGDGITILSNAWSDTNNRPSSTIFANCVSRVSPGNGCSDYQTWASGWSPLHAAPTMVNAAILAGHWPTPCDWQENGCPADGSDAYYADWYGGGIENFPRFLEIWGSAVVFTYKGSLVSPFTSQKTTGTWNGTYYSPPRRDWSFDTDFRDPALLPPGTPNVGQVLRTAMREVF